MRRTLSLKREALTELATNELRNVVGGVPPTLNVRDCLPSMDFSCIDCVTHGPACLTP